MLETIRRLGESALAKLQAIGSAGIFLWQTLFVLPQSGMAVSLLIRQ